MEQNSQNDFVPRPACSQNSGVKGPKKRRTTPLTACTYLGRSIFSHSGASPNAILGKDSIPLAYLVQPLICPREDKLFWTLDQGFGEHVCAIREQNAVNYLFNRYKYI